MVAVSVSVSAPSVRVIVCGVVPKTAGSKVMVLGAGEAAGVGDRLAQAVPAVGVVGLVQDGVDHQAGDFVIGQREAGRGGRRWPPRPSRCRSRRSVPAVAVTLA